MSISPILALHICAGTAGFLAGTVAIFLRKGSQRHRVVGNVFVVSMLALASSGVYMAVMKSQLGNVVGGALTFYLVATAWRTARVSDGRRDVFHWTMLAIAFAIAAAGVAGGITYAVRAATSPTGQKYGALAGQYFFLGSIAVIACVADLRMLLLRTLSPTQRLARHLWRMCFALFIAAGSIFLARQHLFPELLRKSGALFVLSFFPLIAMILWLVRVRFTKTYRKLTMARANDVPAPPQAVVPNHSVTFASR